MIENRPKHLTDQDDYNRLPAEPFSVAFENLPPLLRGCLAPVGGVQPITGAMSKAAGAILRDKPSEGEIEMFRAAGTQFQMISVVASIAHLKRSDGPPHAIPYALALLPASKRGKVDPCSIDYIANIVGGRADSDDSCYTGFDPFCGEWGMYGPLSLFTQKDYNGHLDELGIVVGRYYIPLQHDAADVLETPLGFDNPRLEEKYAKHRGRLLYTPFKKVEARPLWGLDSPIELFLFQELLRRGHEPEPQVLFTTDGKCHASLYHLWKDIEFRHMPQTVTVSDFYFPKQKLAVFCDSSAFHRGAKAQAKDEAIDEKLKAAGYRSVRVQGRSIVKSLKQAADLVEDSL
ncbi:very short patch repair endonuclease [Mesorhizobium sp. M0854]|uniref:hypothetical protein n=1 Tax=Mesorhizobium sp. M0854 TaxID=2957013 RepID=UPI00333963A8